MPDDIPPLLPPDQAPPIRSLADLDRFWRSVKGPWGFSQPQVWCAVLAPAGALTPILIKVEDCPLVPDRELVGHLLDRLTEVVDETVVGGSVALMFARPGGGGLRDGDLSWARHLTAAGHQASIHVWPMFLANDDHVRIAAPDDLGA